LGDRTLAADRFLGACSCETLTAASQEAIPPKRLKANSKTAGRPAKERKKERIKTNQLIQKDKESTLIADRAV
jgi:hypothetical protein